MKTYPDFASAIGHAMAKMKTLSTLVHTESWQGIDISQKPEMATYELLNHSLQVPIQSEDLKALAADIQPNLPWADDHFSERICGYPLNPGRTWETWPYGKSADKFRDAQGKFNHSYAERYFPKFAGRVPATVDPPIEWVTDEKYAHRGIYGPYGDLSDVVKQLVKEPHTRQAILPIFFPEDTGGAIGGRVPCSLHYQFIQRGGYLHIVYQLRSCDIVRHFRDDIYLTVRLLLCMLDSLRAIDPGWKKVKPGLFTMHIVSFHMFKADYQPTFGCAR